MNKLIRNFSNKPVKLEFERKNPSWKSQQDPHWNFNPQYKRPHLQLLQREREDIQPPSYLEYDLEENVEDIIEV